MIVIKTTMFSDESEEKVEALYKDLIRIKNRCRPVRLDEKTRKHIRCDMYLMEVTKSIRGINHVIDVTISDLKGKSNEE